MTTITEHGATPVVAKINGVAVNRGDEWLSEGELRQRACTELLRQAAQAAGLLSAADQGSDDGILSEAASEAIDQLLNQEVQPQLPDEAECRRFYEANPGRFRKDERASLRHILFAVTPGVDVAALRAHAEKVLIDLRCRDQDGGDGFAEVARKFSNCPSGAQGGALGWVGRSECVEEFAREVFGNDTIGVLPRLVLTRFGLHVVDIQVRDKGEIPRYEQVRGAVAATIQRQSFATALRQYLSLLAADAEVEGIALDAAESPLLQ